MTISQTHRELSHELLNWSQQHELNIMTIAAMSLAWEPYVPDDVILSTQETMKKHVKEMLGDD